MNKKIVLVIALPIVLAISAIVVGVMALGLNNEVNKEIQEEPNQYVGTYKIPNVKQIEVVSIGEIEIPEDVATISKLVEVIETKELEEITVKNVVKSNINENINRYQLSVILYSLIEEQDKLPDIYGYQINYKDSTEIPVKYIQPICYVTFLKLVDFGESFEGYQYITIEEMNSALEKCWNYLENYVKPAENNESAIQENDVQREELKQEAIEILVNRQSIDTLNGKSVAKFKNPKSLVELEANIVSIIPVNIIEASEITKNSTQKLEIDYINMDEAILDYSIIDDLTKYIVGVTYAEPLKFEIEFYSDKVLLRNFNIRESYNIIPTIDVIGMKNNKIIARGTYSINADERWETILFEKDATNIDSIGLIVNKSALENISVKDGINETVMVIFKLSDSDKNTLSNWR